MTLQTGTPLDQLKRAIWQTVAYADVFDYPLTAPEIHRYLTGFPATLPEVEQMLLSETSPLSRYGMVSRTGIVSYTGIYYTLPGREAILATRQRRQKVAASLWPQALRYGRLISLLPFMRMVAVTGALAMNNVESEADIDFLIVTEPGHLWLTRALVILLGRISILHGIRLCPNYLVSLQALEFPDHTLYAAHEIAQMIPLAGLEVYQEMRRRNEWVKEFLPNADGIPDGKIKLPWRVPNKLAQPALEALLRAAPFTLLEKWEMERKIHRLSREQRGSEESTFSADVCKGHDQRHQARTQSLLAERLELFERA